MDCFPCHVIKIQHEYGPERGQAHTHHIVNQPEAPAQKQTHVVYTEQQVEQRQTYIHKVRQTKNKYTHTECR